MLYTNRNTPAFVAHNAKTLRVFRQLCIALLFLALAGSGLSAQTFNSLVSFTGSNGASPYYVYLVQGLDGELYGTTSGGGAFNDGTVFKINTAGTLNTLYSFCALSGCSDGFEPFGGLALATNGQYFYGTTGGGGTGYGTVYKINASGTMTTLVNFDDADGYQPFVGLIQATNGDFYGTTTEGGTSGYGTVFKMTASGTLTSLHSFSYTGDGAYPDARLVQGTNGDFYGLAYLGSTVYEITAAGKFSTFDIPVGSGPTGALFQATDGNFYGTTSGGGAYSGGIVYKMTPAGKFTTIYSFCSLTDCADGETPWAGLIQGTDGNLYGTTAGGGANSAGTVFSITTVGKLITLYSFCSQSACADGSSPYEGLVQATNGVFYGTTYTGGTSNLGTVYSISVGLPAFVETLVHSGKVGLSVTILGTNLTGTTGVSFGAGSASFKVVSSSEITATVPAGATTGSISVTTPNGVLTSNTTFQVTPQITSFTPTSGPAGTSVTITGVSLTQTSKVTFGGVKATSFTVNSDTQVTATVPTGAKTGKIGISTSGGSATSKATFTVT